jgi:tripartite-type tricarboxylate transporter receptor subunit TctC
MLRYFAILVFLASLSATADQAADTAWPTRPVRLVVAHGAGGLTDVLARELADRLEQRWGKPVVVENKPSAGGFLATQVVAQAPGDGYQLLLQNSALVMGELLLDDARPQMLFRQVRPVVMLGVAPSILVMRTQAPGANFSDWLRLARSDGVDVASCGNGKAQHFALTLMTSGFGLNLRHIPYNTCAQAVWGVLSGTVASGLVTIEVALPQIRSGKLTALAVTSRERFQPLAQVPSLHELGLQDFDLVTWYGVFAPKSLSPDLAARLFEDIRATLRESAAAPAERAITYVVKDGAEFNKQIEQDFLLYQRLSGGGKR